MLTYIKLIIIKNKKFKIFLSELVYIYNNIFFKFYIKLNYLFII